MRFVILGLGKKHTLSGLITWISSAKEEKLVSPPQKKVQLLPFLYRVKVTLFFVFPLNINLLLCISNASAASACPCIYMVNKTGLQPVSKPVGQIPLVHPIYRKTVTRKKNGGVKTGLMLKKMERH